MSDDEPAAGDKRPTSWKPIIIALLVVGAIAWVGSSLGDDSGSGNTGEKIVDSFTPVEVRYELGGSASSADITMETATGTSQQSGVDVPLRSKSGTSGLRVSFQRGAFVNISAQNNGSGSITCRIVGSDGTVISTNTSQGEFAIATCKGSAR